MEQGNGKKPNRPVHLLFPVLWVLVFIAIGVSLALNTRTAATYSEQENRMLQGLPALTLQSMVGGSFSGDFENYLLDNFKLRNQFIDASADIQNLMSVASFDQTILGMEEQKDELVADISTLPPLPLDDASADEEGLDTALPEETPIDIETDVPDDTGVIVIPTDDATTQPPASDSTAATAKPVATPKPTYPSTVSLYYTLNGKKVALRNYRAKNVEYGAKIINAYAACLKQGGRLCVIVPPSSQIINKFILNKQAKDLKSNIEDCLRANVSDNVNVFSVPEILSGPISRGEYVYFRTDRHWTPLGSHYVYEAMMKKMGMEPIPYSSYKITQEHPFLGTLYRDSPSASMRRNPDTLDVVQPYGKATFYEMLSPGKFTEAPLLDMKAHSNDRHAIYLGNSQAAWTYIKTEAHTGRKALVVRDSFGASFSPYLVPHYDEIHIVNPEYYNKRVAGGSVKELMKKYGIDDCYIVISDVRSFNSEFLMSIMPRMLN